MKELRNSLDIIILMHASHQLLTAINIKAVAWAAPGSWIEGATYGWILRARKSAAEFNFLLGWPILNHLTVKSPEETQSHWLQTDQSKILPINKTSNKQTLFNLVSQLSLSSLSLSLSHSLTQETSSFV